eukprot:scaffold5048_cov121-Cylindrotheca_fusiformis.AAC.25
MEPHSSIDTHSEARKILSDDPQLSSAALCITLHHLTQSFRPEFTHQCVETETFRGHQPLESALLEAQSTLPPTDGDDEFLLHGSHLHHDEAINELEIQVQLAPSCRRCQVHINSRPKKRKKSIAEKNESQSKKIKLTQESSTVTTTESQEAATGASVVTPNEKLPASTIAHAIPSSSSGVMSTKEIQESISIALPQIVDDPCNEDYVKAPIGSVLEEYAVQGDQFVLCLADGTTKGVSEYHQQVQRIALWFIENADDVDISDTSAGGFWKVLYLFQKHQKGYALVGYVTLYHFNAPFHRPKPGIIARVCQALVLPSFQRQGHGKRMMRCIYDRIGNNDDDHSNQIVQINVEDPAPGFVAMRNKVDLEWLQDHPDWWPQQQQNQNMEDEAFFHSIPEAELVPISARAKITPHQIQIVHELVKLKALQSYESTATTTTIGKEELERRYRILVKRRLNKDHREEMCAFSTKEEKKEYLARHFEDQLVLYKTILGKS